MSDQIEIERKWVLRKPATLSGLRSEEIVQGYIIMEPGELRIRTKGGKFFLTVKGDGTISRSEWEVEIPEWVFNQLVLSTSNMIQKNRLRVSIPGPPTLEWDIFYGPLWGLQMVEAEWVGPPEDEVALRAEAEAYVFPVELFGEAIEVTDDPRYKNKSLAVHGCPSDL